MAHPVSFILNPLRLTALQIPIQTQYHSQDELGQYSYGYSSPLSAKNEIRTADGVTYGGYAYVDSNGILQNVQYTVDATSGFRVSASNLPQPPVADLTLPSPVQNTPEVEQARLEHLKVFENNRRVQEEIRNNLRTSTVPAITPVQQVLTSPVALQLARVPVFYSLGYNSLLFPSISSQYHSQNGLGQFTFGYANQVGTKLESDKVDIVSSSDYSSINPSKMIPTKYPDESLDQIRLLKNNSAEESQTTEHNFENVESVKKQTKRVSKDLQPEVAKQKGH